MNAICICCKTRLVHYLKTKDLSITKCHACKTLFAQHHTVSTSNPWIDSVITKSFLSSLVQRRLLQAQTIVRLLYTFLKNEVILDYGCGQGVFTSTALSKKIDCTGFDMYFPTNAFIKKDHFIELSSPWQMPDCISTYSTIVLLDVLEHHTHPEEFLAMCRDQNIKYLIIKVPLVNGPMGLIARICARLGYPYLLERLFLVNQALPHQVFFSEKGIIRLAHNAHYNLFHELKLADVGRELPERMRIKNTILLKPILTLIGIFFESMAWAWSDTSVFVFELQKDKSD